MPEPALRVVANPEFERLDALKAERRKLLDELAGITAQQSKLRGAEEAEARAAAAIADLGRAELAEMQRWLSSASAEPAPRPDMDRRAALNHALAEAMAQAETMRAAIAGLDAGKADLAHRLAAIEKQIDFAAVEALKVQLDAELSELNRMADRVARGLADRAALRMLVAEIGRAKSDGGDIEAGRPYFQLGERMANEAAIETLPTNGAVLDAIDDQKRRLMQLREGSR